MRTNLAQQILDKTDRGLNVFNLYMPTSFVPKKKFRNPFYEDHNPGCCIYYERHLERYYMKDHGDPSYSGDCFWLVALVKELDVKTDFMDILRIINHDMGLNLDIKEPNVKTKTPPNRVSPTPRQTNMAPQVKPKPKSYELVSRDMNANELAYWGMYGIKQDTLNKYGVVAVASYTSENDRGPFTISPQAGRFVFAYTMPKFVKIYRPNEQFRFLYGGEKPSDYCFGLRQLPTSGDMVFITGGEKDVLSLAAHGFHAVCFNSETADFPENVISILTERFRHIVIMYDCDKTGIMAMNKQTELWKDEGLISVTLPLAGTKEDKDISDFFKKGKTAEELKEIVFDLIASYYEDSMRLISACEMDFSNPPSASECVMRVGDVPVASCENLICVTGGEGAGKSNFVSSLLAGALLTSTPETKIDTLGFDITPNFKKKAVLHFDTEQSEQQLYKNTMMMLKRSGLSSFPPFFHSYYFATYNRMKRLEDIKNSMSFHYLKHGGIYMVVIDGVADLLTSANDEKVSVNIVEELFKLASCYQACIICVLHYVPNGLKLRGHIGSEFQRKSATILSVEKDDNPAYFVVKAQKLREGNPLDVPMLQFTWDKELNMPVYCGQKSEAAAAKHKEEVLNNTVKAIYVSGNEGFTHKELVSRIIEEADVKERTAKSYISDLYNAKTLIKEGEKYVINKQKGKE